MALLLWGKPVAKTIIEEAKHLLGDSFAAPHLAIINTTGRFDASLFTRVKAKAINSLGWKCSVFNAQNQDINQIGQTIRDCNMDATYHGIMLQLPLRSDLQLYERELLDVITVAKDVDGLNSSNLSKFMTGYDKRDAYFAVLSLHK